MPVDPTHTLIQITDLHVGLVDDPPRHGVDTFAVVQRALAAVEAADVAPAALLFTGDIVERATPAAYRRVRELVEPVARRLGAPAVWVAGNHDVRATLREHLLGVPPFDAPLDQVHRLGDLRVVVLDSTVPKLAHGRLEPEQLDWLRAELAEPAPAGTVLALHHPPLPSPSRLTAAMELQRRHELAAVLAGSDVRIVLAGHTHVVSAGAIAGIPVWTGGAAPFVNDALAPDGGARGLALPTISRVDLFADAVIATAVTLDAEPVFRVPRNALEAHVEEMEAELRRSRRR